MIPPEQSLLSQPSSFRDEFSHRALTSFTAEQRKVLFDWNDTWADYPRDSCLHHLIQAQAARTPNATAMRGARERLTYREVDARAEAVAEELREAGVGPEDLVGLYVNRSPSLIVGLLGILKAGGAYVPLDPTYPKQRRDFVVRDSAMRLIVTEESLVSGLSGADLRAVCIDRVRCDRPRTSSSRAPRAENLAYVIYTSGSTGIPKGVMVPHRALVNYLVWAATAYDVRAGSGAPVHSSISFDLTITGLLAPLLVGRCVEILPDEQGLGALATILRRRGDFSLVKITPAHLHMLCAQFRDDQISAATRMFVIGGEALFGSSLESWRCCSPDAAIVNEYGPTEATVGCCAYFVPNARSFDGTIPIGRPIANTQLYVLDEKLQPVEIGGVGELYVAGDGLARGYLNRPELTAQKFVQNPFASEDVNTSRLMYRTGDCVRYLPDGNLEFVRRIDDQLKIRSYSIEPSEVEAALRTHSAVLNAAVVSEQSGTREKQLVAYIRSRNAAAPGAAQLRQHLKAILPDYMVPSVFRTAAEFPLTPNGKIDRPALQRLDVSASRNYVGARNETEWLLAEIWEKSFGQSHIGVHDAFFDLGGDSLLAVELIEQVNRRFNTGMDPVIVHQYPTVAKMARAVAAAQAPHSGPQLIALQTIGRGSPIFFIGLPLQVSRLAETLADEHASFISSAPIAPEVFAAAARGDYASVPGVAQLAAPHAALIRSRPNLRSCLLAGYSASGVIAFETAHQLVRYGVSVPVVFLFDSELKMPEWERVKRRARFHARHLRHGGLQYIAAKARERFAQRAVSRSVIPLEDENDRGRISAASVPWAVTNRIWQQALRSYPRRALPARGVLFRATGCERNEYQNFDGCLGWRNLFHRGLQVIDVPGEHRSMWEEPNLATLLAAWRAAADPSPNEFKD